MPSIKEVSGETLEVLPSQTTGNPVAGGAVEVLRRFTSSSDEGKIKARLLIYTTAIVLPISGVLGFVELLTSRGDLRDGNYQPGLVGQVLATKVDGIAQGLHEWRENAFSSGPDNSSQAFSPTPMSVIKVVSTPTSVKPSSETAVCIKYAVRRGDTLWALAKRYNTTISKIASANGIPNPNKIRTGQILMINCGRK